MGLAAGAPAGSSNLGGVVDTNLLQFGLTAQPLTKLHVIANMRYEDKNDKTPVSAYNLTGASPAVPYSNGYSSSARKINGKLEGAYQLPHNYRATVTVDYATVARAVPPSATSLASTDLGYALGGMRENTRDLGYRAELRRTLSDTLNAAVSYGRSRKNGDSWVIYDPAGTLPVTMMDRVRNKAKMMAEWMPRRNVSVQFNVEEGQDSYTGPTAVGMRDTRMDTYSIDTAYIVSENWKINGYISQSNQTLHVNHGSPTTYMADLDDLNTCFGIGVVGKPTVRLDIGGNLSYMNDKNRYNGSWSNGAAVTGGGLPNVTYRSLSMKMYGKYALQNNADVRVDLVHQKARLDEWTWGNNGTPFAYSDNTTVTMQPSQSVTFIGASYVYKFR